MFLGFRSFVKLMSFLNITKVLFLVLLLLIAILLYLYFVCL